MTAVLLLAVIAVLAVSLLALHKVRHCHLMLYEIQADTRAAIPRAIDGGLRQLEILTGLYKDLGLERSLRPTRGWAASPDFLAILAEHALRGRPRVIVECGSGVSTVVLARCAQLSGHGHVYSLEHSAEHAAATTAELERHGLGERASVLFAPLVEGDAGGERVPWYDLSVLPDGEIDMVIVDGPPGTLGPLARYPAGPRLFPRLGPVGAVFVDDAKRPDEQVMVRRWLAEGLVREVATPETEKGCVVLRRA